MLIARLANPERNIDVASKGIHYLNLGPWPCYVGITTCEKAFADEMKRLKISDVNFLVRTTAGATTHIFENRNSLCFIITILPFNARKQSYEQYMALVAHEAMHVIQEMRKELARGGSLGDEAEAYLIQQIVQEAGEFIFRTNKVRRTEPAP